MIKEIKRKAYQQGYEFTDEECRRVLSRISLDGSLLIEEAIEDVAYSTNCPARRVAA